MIDLHTHILPHIDDGCKTMAEAMSAMQKAALAGIRMIVATPHVPDPFSDRWWPVVTSAYEALRQRLRAEQNDMPLGVGAECSLVPDLARQIKAHKYLTINGQCRYALVSFPAFSLPPFVEEVIFELQIQGVTPVLAHPERTLELHRDDGKLRRLLSRGALCQMNAGSLLGRYGSAVRKTARTWLKEGLVDILASDLHTVPSEDHPLVEALHIAEKLVGSVRAHDLVCTVPERIVAGEAVSAPPGR